MKKNIIKKIEWQARGSFVAKLYAFLWAIFHPAYWIQLHEYSEEWDSKLLELMQSHRFEKKDSCSQYYASLRNYSIWIENKPYATMHPEHIKVRARRYTIHLCIKKIASDFICEAGK